MPQMIAEGLLGGLAFYAAIGLSVAIWLFAFGLKRFDPVAASAPAYVKALWLPGMVALWPALLLRAFGVSPPEDRP